MSHDERVSYVRERLLREYHAITREVPLLNLTDASQVCLQVVLLDVAENIASRARNKLATALVKVTNT